MIVLINIHDVDIRDLNPLVSDLHSLRRRYVEPNISSLREVNNILDI